MGRFYEPTIIADMHQGMRHMTENTQGPILGIETVKGPDEVCQTINSMKYRLESYIFSKDSTTID